MPCVLTMWPAATKEFLKVSSFDSLFNQEEIETQRS